MSNTPASGRKRFLNARNLSLILLVVALTIVSIFGLRTLSSSLALDSMQTDEPQQPTSAPTPQPPRSIRISAAGDVMLHQRQLNDAKQSDGTYDFSNYFTEVEPFLSGADLTFLNLETTLPGSNYSGYPHFRGPDSILDALKSAGVDVITTCNNHAFDDDFDTIVRTIETIQAYGFHQTGTYKSQEDYNTPTIINVNGINVGVIAYTKNVNGREKAVSAEQLSFCIRFIANADYKTDVQALRDAGADIVVAVMHWGYEYERTPRSSIRAEAEEMIEAGVDLILGSHPHVVQPIEVMEVEKDDGTTARGVVVFSMGNFISNQRKRYTDCGIIFNITFTEDETGHFVVEDMSYLPTYVNRKPGYTDYRILPVYEYMQDETLFETLDDYNQGRLERAWTDVTALLEDGPAVMVSELP